MAPVQYSFDNYKIFQWSHHSPNLQAAIYCYSGKTYVGRMIFASDEMPLPSNGPGGPFPGADPTLEVYFPISRFNDVVTMVREEKPLYLFLNLDNGIGVFGTDSFEPIGEEEGS